ncbi:hypothetical protein M407DRAFT_84869, partial [Tulasnella calospora MUT 4182]
MLAIVRALKYWRHYLEGAKFPIRILTDHKNLEYFKKAQVLNHRQHRWLQELARFDFTIEYRPGTKSGKPDALSRRSDHRPEEGAEEPSLTLLPPSKIVEVNANDDEEVALASDQEVIQDEMKDYTLEQGILKYRNRIYVPNDEEIKRMLLQLYHDSVMAGHPGQAKTLDLVSRGYYWPSQKAYVNRYVDGCDTCQRNKPQHRSTGLLKPLPVPTGPWQDLSYDFITKLPKTRQGNDTILVVVDRLLKEGHFVATKELGLDAKKTADLFITNVWRLHGTPARIVSDRGPQFNAPFIKAFYKGLGINPIYSTAYHPQTDGQTERTNQNVEGFLRMYCSHRQDDWDELLPFAEFAYNNSIHSSIGTSPFMASRGYNPMFTNMPSAAQSSPEAEERLERIKFLQEEIQSAMTLAQERQKRFYNEHRDQEAELEENDRVWLESKNITTDRPSTKLAAKRLGPYHIKKKISSHAYELDLPSTMKIHPVFHISLLTRYEEDTIPGRIQPTPPPVIVDEEEEWEVEAILNSRYYRKKLQYLIKWKGFDDSHNSWQPEADVEHCQELVEEYHRRFP